MKRILCTLLVLSLLPMIAYAQEMRAWHPGTEQMAFVDGVTGWAPDRLITIGENENIPEASLELMLTTGLASADETVIFQGDILDAPDGYTYIIEHDGVEFRVRKAGTTDFRSFESLKQNAGQCNIVGNVWQNPGIDKTRRIFETLKRARNLWQEFNGEEKAAILGGIESIEDALAAYQERQGEPE